MKWNVVQTGQFKKDLKRYKHDQYKMDLLDDVLVSLVETGTVPRKMKPHKLCGNYKGHIECHIESNFLLIWIDEAKQTIKLVRLGTHSELFSL